MIIFFNLVGDSNLDTVHLSRKLIKFEQSLKDFVWKSRVDFVKNSCRLQHLNFLSRIARKFEMCRIICWMMITAKYSNKSSLTALNPSSHSVSHQNNMQYYYVVSLVPNTICTNLNV